MMNLLNLGCGNNFHKDWVNVDFNNSGEDVIIHNLLNGIPFPDSSFDVIYHSHVLEHFPKHAGERFIKECHRVLKTNGVIRVVVPDLETIAREYLRNLDRALHNEPLADLDYEWIMLEMFDQTTRNYIGGEMAKYLQKPVITNKEYVFSRIGNEAKLIHDTFLNSMNNTLTKEKITKTNIIKRIIKKVYKYAINKKKISYATEIGEFRLSGEIHQWMYDKYSLRKLLENAGFKQIEIQSANTSCIKNWNSYCLDIMIDGSVRKPDSLYIEAKK